jgi:hypothetical protein
VTQQSLTLDELLDQLHLALVRQHTRRRRRVVYTLAILAAGVTATVALGATYGHWLSSYTQDENFAQCMRSNGLPSFRDPSSNEHPLSISQIDPNSPAFQAAYKACQNYAPNGHAGPPAPTAAQLGAALGFARCMRAHRFPRFPDPLTTYGPGLTLARGEYFPPNSTTDFQTPSPALKQAANACGVQLPSGPP